MSASSPAAHSRYRASSSGRTASPASGGKAPPSTVAARAEANSAGAIHSTIRFASGAARDSVPKQAAQRGAVVTITPRLAETEAERKRQSFPAFPGRRRTRAPYSRGVASSRPATAAKDSCKLTDATAKGLSSRITSSAPDRAVGVSPSRPASGASRTNPTITQERTTDGVHPTMTI